MASSSKIFIRRTILGISNLKLHPFPLYKLFDTIDFYGEDLFIEVYEEIQNT